MTLFSHRDQIALTPYLRDQKCIFAPLFYFGYVLQCFPINGSLIIISTYLGIICYSKVYFLNLQQEKSIEKELACETMF